jgi:hypothetical protein
VIGREVCCKSFGAVHGAIVGVSSRIVAHPDAKRALRARTGALAVDNESHVVASAAAARGLPMAAVRVIMDPVTRELPASALAAVRANGTIDLAAVIRSLAREPSDLPMLLRTTLDALIGFAALFRCRHWSSPGATRLANTHARAKGKHGKSGRVALRFERIIPGALMTIDIAELFARRERERDAPPRQNPTSHSGPNKFHTAQGRLWVNRVGLVPARDFRSTPVNGHLRRRSACLKCEERGACNT